MRYVTVAVLLMLCETDSVGEVLHIRDTSGTEVDLAECEIVDVSERTLSAWGGPPRYPGKLHYDDDGIRVSVNLCRAGIVAFDATEQPPKATAQLEDGTVVSGTVTPQEAKLAGLTAMPGIRGLRYEIPLDSVLRCRTSDAVTEVNRFDTYAYAFRISRCVLTDTQGRQWDIIGDATYVSTGWPRRAEPLETASLSLSFGAGTIDIPFGAITELSVDDVIDVVLASGHRHTGMLAYDRAGQEWRQFAGRTADAEIEVPLDRIRGLMLECTIAPFCSGRYSPSSVAFTPDGELLADTNGKLWHVSTGRYHTSFEHAVAFGATGVVFTPDGRLVALGSWRRIGLWDVHSLQQVAVLEGDTDRVSCVAFAPDGKLLASGSWDDTIRLWDVASGECRATLHGHTEQVNSMAFSRDGKLLASASRDKSVKLWDVTNRECQTTLEGHTREVTSVAFSPDGRLLASGSRDDTVRLWDVVAAECIGVLEGHRGWVNSVTFGPDGALLASCSDDEAVKLWDVASRECVATLTGHTGDVEAVAFSPDGSVLASVGGYGDESVRLWDVATFEEITPQVDMAELLR